MDKNNINIHPEVPYVSLEYDLFANQFSLATALLRKGVFGGSNIPTPTHTVTINVTAPDGSIKTYTYERRAGYHNFNLDAHHYTVVINVDGKTYTYTQVEPGVYTKNLNTYTATIDVDGVVRVYNDLEPGIKNLKLEE